MNTDNIENTKKRSWAEELTINARKKRITIDLTETEVIDLTSDDESDNRNNSIGNKENKGNTTHNIQSTKVTKKNQHAQSNKIHRSSENLYQVFPNSPKLKSLPSIPDQTRLLVLIDLDQRANFISDVDIPFKKVVVYGFMGPHTFVHTKHATVVKAHRSLKEAADYEMMLYVSGWLARNQLTGKSVVVISGDRGLANVAQILGEWGVKAAIVNDKKILSSLVSEAERL